MSTEQLIADAMDDGGLADTDERAAITDAIHRDQELSSGRVTGRTHEEVMQAARRALECQRLST